MECNKDEALRSQIIAEQKFLKHDLVGAKKSALKAQYLFPDLEGLPQLIAVLDVHIIAQQKVDGVDANWYGILQTDEMADEATIRRQYRKLALILHPDKNKAVGAEGAFKLISEAWRILSDKEKKAALDARRMVKTNIAPSFPPMKPTNRFCNFTHFSAWCQRIRVDKKNSFWTGCPSCEMQFEYMRVHENKKISCPECGKFFMATEIPSTTGHTSSSHQAVRKAGSSCSEKQFQTYKNRPAHVGSSFSVRWGICAAAAAQTEVSKSTAEMVHETYEAVKRERVKAQKEAREKEAMVRMEEEREAKRREHWNRRQKRKQEYVKSAKLTTCVNGSCEKVLGTESMSSGVMESRRAETTSFVPLERVENGIWRMSQSDAIDGQKEFGTGIAERIARLGQGQEPFQCRISNTFDSTSSYESSDVFSFSKRLKVDVRQDGIAL